MSTIITPSEEQINIVVNDEKISINVESGDVIVNVNEQIVEVSTVNGGYPLPSTVYSVFGRTGNIIAVDGDYDLGELGDVTLVSSTNGDVLTYDGTKWINKAVTGTGTVTSVDMSVPVGLQVSGNPITINGTIALNYAAGYSLPTTAKQTTWDTAYNDSIISASVSGTTTKTLTLNQQDGGTITASWTDIDTNLVTSVNGYVGTVVLTTSDIAEGSRLYYTETRVSNNTDVAANTAARHSAVTIGTANGLSLTSQVLSLALASASTTGALSSTDWVKFNTAYNDSIVSASVSGTTTKTLTLTQQDAGTITASWSDLAASGTVTSVGASVPTGMTISGSPIVNAGTLAFGLDTGYTIPLSTQLVPSGGSEGQLLAKYSATNYDTIWIDNYTEQLRDTVKAAVAINKGQAVYVSDANGTNQIVSLASNASEGTSSKTLGLASQNFAINDIGQIITEGLLSGINTSNSYAGDPVWLGVSGNLIFGLANKPVAPAHLVYIGVVTRAQLNNGEIYVKIQNGFELQELHNVLISSVANNEGLFYDTSTSLWKNKSIATVLGYTPISLTSLSGVSPLSYNNTTGAFSIAQATTSANGYLSSTDWNTFNGKQAALNGTGFVKATGTTISYDNSTYYLASNPNAYIALTGLTATAPLSYNNTTGGFTISQAGVSANGYLSSTDWNTFNDKQAAGNYITALSGEATASGPGSAAVTLSTSAVTGKILTGVNITGGSITATDSILVAFGKVQNQINGVLGGAIYQSVWNASTNSPTLTSGTGTKGYYYIVSVAGSTNLDGITDWKVGDWAIFNGTTWNKVDNSDAVSSVNGFTGAVSLTTANISEVTNLYYTEGRVSANTDVAANTAARHAAVTLGTANGLSLSTQALSLGLASTSATGALSSTDWNTFNLKQAALSGTGFVKISGSTISYDNSTYLTTSAAASTYLALAGGTLTGALGGTSATFSGTMVVGGTSSTQQFSVFGANDTRAEVVTTGNSTSGVFFRVLSSGTKVASSTIRVTNSGILEFYNGGASETISLSIAANNAATFTSSVTATSFVKTSGTSSQFLKADGSVDSTSYQGAITLTTTGTSGAATFSANTLNIPNYAPDLSGYVTLATTQTISGAKTFSSSIAANVGMTIGSSGTNDISWGTAGGIKLSRTNVGPEYALSQRWTGTLAYIDIASSTQWNGGVTILPNGGGNVGIGTDTPINGKLDVRGNSGSFAGYFLGGSTTSSSYGVGISAGTNSTDFALLVRNKAETLTLLQVMGNGNVGIGVTPSAWSVPFNALQLGTYGQYIAGQTNAADMKIGTNHYYGSGDYRYFNSISKVSRYDIGADGFIWNVAPIGTANAAITFTQAMTLTSSGYLGIGMILPTTRLFVQSADADFVSVFKNTNASGYGLQVYTQGSSSNLAFQVRTNNGSTNALQVLDNGDVGVGITNPGARFEAQSGTAVPFSGTGYRTAIFSSTTAAASDRPGVTLGYDTTGGGIIATATQAGTTNFLSFWTYNGAWGERLRIAKDGASTFTSSVTATGFFESSDSRLKTLIQDNYQTKGIASITPKLYTKNGKVELGYYAQDFVGILDSAVSKGSDDMLSLSYREVHTAKIYALEQEIKELKAKMN